MIFRENPSEKPRHDRSHPKQPGCTAWEMRFYFQCAESQQSCLVLSVRGENAETCFP